MWWEELRRRRIRDLKQLIAVKVNNLGLLTDREMRLDEIWVRNGREPFSQRNRSWEKENIERLQELLNKFQAMSTEQFRAFIENQNNKEK